MIGLRRLKGNDFIQIEYSILSSTSPKVKNGCCLFPDANNKHTFYFTVIVHHHHQNPQLSLRVHLINIQTKV